MRIWVPTTTRKTLQGRVPTGILAYVLQHRDAREAVGVLGMCPARLVFASGSPLGITVAEGAEGSPQTRRHTSSTPRRCSEGRPDEAIELSLEGVEARVEVCAQRIEVRCGDPSTAPRWSPGRVVVVVDDPRSRIGDRAPISPLSSGRDDDERRVDWGGVRVLVGRQRRGPRGGVAPRCRHPRRIIDVRGGDEGDDEAAGCVRPGVDRYEAADPGVVRRRNKVGGAAGWTIVGRTRRPVGGLVVEDLDDSGVLRFVVVGARVERDARDDRRVRAGDEERRTSRVFGSAEVDDLCRERRAEADGALGDPREAVVGVAGQRSGHSAQRRRRAHPPDDRH
mmetsp:Transcript_1450/g.5626  ORF Transcript_1450/g.5626 Transcript_1450/m.5626 type:complete len:337 (-) Transcript_1450:950-1960(-)